MTKVEQDKDNANVGFNYFYAWRPQGKNTRCLL